MRRALDAICLSTLLSITAGAFAHGGGLDGHGCHHNRKAGGYHGHRGLLAGKSYSSQAEMLENLRKLKSGQVKPDGKDSR